MQEKEAVPLLLLSKYRFGPDVLLEIKTSQGVLTKPIGVDAFLRVRPDGKVSLLFLDERKNPRHYQLAGGMNSFRGDSGARL